MVTCREDKLEDRLDDRLDSQPRTIVVEVSERRSGGAAARPAARHHQPVVAPTPMSASRRGDASRRGAGGWAFLLALGTAGALAHVAIRFEGLEVAYALGHERKVGADLEEQRRRLQIEIGMLKDPSRVVSIAREQLKMGPPTPDAIRRLGSGTPLFDNPPTPSPPPPPPRPARAAETRANDARKTAPTRAERVDDAPGERR